MDSIRDEENKYSSIDYKFLAVDRESANLTSRSQLRSSEGNTYEESSSAVKKREQKMFELGETLPFVKNKEKIHEKYHESTICSIKCRLIRFILLISALSLLFCLHYLQVIEFSNRGLKTREVDEEILLAAINEQKKIISEKEAVMLLGGWRYYITNSATIYNSMEKSWKNCKLTLPSRLARHGAAIINNEIYIFGGYGNGTYESRNSLYKLGAENKWERMADMNETRFGISQSSVVFNSEIWVIGGWNGTNSLKSVEKFNPNTNKWTKMPELNESRTLAAATVVDGKIYISGGWDGWRIKNSVEVYDPEKGKWEIFTPSIPYAIHSHILIGNHSHLIAIGGGLSTNEPTSSVWKIDVLDPKREWKEMPYLRQGRYHSSAAIIPDRFMVFGGSISLTQRIDSVEIFDGVEWKKGANLPDKRGLFASIPLTYAQERFFLKQYCQNS